MPPARQQLLLKGTGGVADPGASPPQVADLQADAAQSVVRPLTCSLGAARTRLLDAARARLPDAMRPRPALQAAAICGAGGEARAVAVDVCNYQQQRDMFEGHLKAYGALDFAILNAGVGEQGVHSPDASPR